MANDPVIEPSSGPSAPAPGSVVPASISTSPSDKFVFPATVECLTLECTDGATWQREITIADGQMAFINPNSGYKTMAFSDADINFFASLDIDTGHDHGIFGGDWLYVGATSRDNAVILRADSTTKGALLPRMTSTQKNAIATPPEGLLVYDTVLHALCVYDGSGWKTVTVS